MFFWGKKQKKVYTNEDLSRLSDYVYFTLKKGFNDDDIQKRLLSAGWDKKIIQNLLAKGKRQILGDDLRNEHEAQKSEINHESEKRSGMKEYEAQKSDVVEESEKRGETMAKKMTKEQAQHLLRNVEEGKSFWVNDGNVLRNLFECSEAIKGMSNETFSYHVNKERNDFATWVAEAVEDQTLAKNIAKAKSKNTLVKRLDGRLNSLKKVIE